MDEFKRYLKEQNFISIGTIKTPGEQKMMTPAKGAKKLIEKTPLGHTSGGPALSPKQLWSTRKYCSRANILARTFEHRLKSFSSTVSKIVWFTLVKFCEIAVTELFKV